VINKNIPEVAGGTVQWQCQPPQLWNSGGKHHAFYQPRYRRAVDGYGFVSCHKGYGIITCADERMKKKIVTPMY
jgi:hypothetical protein